MKSASSIQPPRLSPLRYPGGKQLFAPYVAGVIEENFLSGCTFYEPFAGGGAVSLELLHLGYVERVVMLERDPLVFAFWWCVCNAFDELKTKIENGIVSIDVWKEMSSMRNVDSPDSSQYSVVELGYAGLFFNRTNFSGILGAGPIGGMSQGSKYAIDCRFNKNATLEVLDRLRPLTSRIEINFGDALTWIPAQKKKILASPAFFYVDPPYYGQGKKLYRHSFTDTQHKSLAQLLIKAHFPWLVSYDDAPFIHELYRGSKMQPIFMDHRVKSSRLAREIAISNLEIPPPVYEGFSSASLRPFSEEVFA